MLSVPIERSCLVNDEGKLAVVSTIFLSNNGETFAALAVDNNNRIHVPKVYKHDNYT
jgi:hypothetical protein